GKEIYVQMKLQLQIFFFVYYLKHDKINFFFKIVVVYVPVLKGGWEKVEKKEQGMKKNEIIKEKKRISCEENRIIKEKKRGRKKINVIIKKKK
ncbi:hypothetical protein RFI_37207, partial [Reticulomyxa filosa]